MKRQYGLNNNIGLSLIELVVTIAIMALVSAGVGVAVVSATRNYSRGNSEISVQQDIQTVTNILSNIIVDSKIARNSAIDEAGSQQNLFVSTSDGKAYQIQLSEGTLYYGRPTYDAVGDSFSVLETSSMVKLADYVEVFSANTDSYKTDYSVKFTIKLNSSKDGAAGNNREMFTSFSVTSRNAGSDSTIVTVSNGATILCENQAVIEPHNTITLNYDVITSGTVTDNTIIEPIICYSDLDCNNKVPDGTVSVEAKNDSDGNRILSVKADESISSLPISKFFIKLETKASDDSSNPYDKKIIEVYVRKVNSIGLLGNNTDDGNDPGNKDVGTKFQRGAKYELNTSLDIYNGERFFAFLTDMDYPTVYDSDKNPFSVKYVFEKKGFDLKNVSVTVYEKDEDGNKTLVTATCNAEVFNSSSNYYDSRKNLIIEVKLDKSMTKGSWISCTAIAIHAAYSKTGLTALNKESKKYKYVYDTWKLEPPASSITRGQIGGSPIEGSDSSKYQRDQGWARFVDLFYRPTMLSIYADNDSVLSKLNDASEIQKLKNQYNKVNIGRFYSIGSMVKPTEPAANNENYFRHNPDEDEYNWSQYRLLSTELNNPNWNLEVEMSMRMDPDSYYELEFVDVIYTIDSITTPTGNTINAGVILWPYYGKLLDLGFGSSSTHVGGMGLKFWNYADEITAKALGLEFNEINDASFHSSVENYPIYPAEIKFHQNTTYGVYEGATTIGSPDSPIKIPADPNVQNPGTSVFSYDQADWQGLTYQSFQNDIGAVLEMYNGESGWSKVADLNMRSLPGPATVKEYSSSIGGFKINLTNTAYEISRLDPKPDDYVEEAIFRLHLNVAAQKRYIIDSEGVLSKKIYKDTNRSIYNYPNGIGYVYFQIQYPEADYILLDYNDGYGGVRKVEIKNNGNSKPLSDYPTNEEKEAHAQWGYVFDGWYTDATLTTRVPESSNTANSYKDYWKTTVYARWVKVGEATVNLDANGGSCSISSITVREGETITLPDATLEGQTFLGWFTQRDGGTQVTSGSYDVLKNYSTLFARYISGSIPEYGYSYSLSGQWDGNKNYNIVFTNNTDSFVSSITVAIPYHGTVYSIDGNVSGTVSGDGYIYVTCTNSGNGFNPHSSSGEIYSHITGSGDFGFGA